MFGTPRWRARLSGASPCRRPVQLGSTPAEPCTPEHGRMDDWSRFYFFIFRENQIDCSWKTVRLTPTPHQPRHKVQYFSALSNKSWFRHQCSLHRLDTTMLTYSSCQTHKYRETFWALRPSFSSASDQHSMSSCDRNATKSCWKDRGKNKSHVGVNTMMRSYLVFILFLT